MDDFGPKPPGRGLTITKLFATCPRTDDLKDGRPTAPGKVAVYGRSRWPRLGDGGRAPGYGSPIPRPVRSRQLTANGSPRRDGAIAPTGRSSRVSLTTTGRWARVGSFCPGGAARGQWPRPEGTAEFCGRIRRAPRRRQSRPRELVPAPVTVAEAQ